MSLEKITAWTFLREIPIPASVAPLLVANEVPVAAYQTFRDSAIFTNRRLIVRDAQGMTGKKTEFYSLPYTSIQMWSSETAGFIDLNGELTLWTLHGNIVIKLGRQIDIRRLDWLLGNAVLNSQPPRY